MYLNMVVGYDAYDFAQSFADTLCDTDHSAEFGGYAAYVSWSQELNSIHIEITPIVAQPRPNPINFEITEAIREIEYNGWLLSSLVYDHDSSLFTFDVYVPEDSPNIHITVRAPHVPTLLDTPGVHYVGELTDHVRFDDLRAQAQKEMNTKQFDVAREESRTRRIELKTENDGL